MDSPQFFINLARLKSKLDTIKEINTDIKVVIPGDIITTATGFMRGHGTYTEESDESKKLFASVAGVVEHVNKLVSVRPLKTRYAGEVGDVVVGRVLEVGQKQWKIDIKSKLDATLKLSSVNLPGGELRRRSEEDEKWMREYLSEGDLISAEVQTVFANGVLSLHTRSLKYGKLSQGILLSVFPSLIKKRKTHFHNLACGVSVILGNNGYIWISTTAAEDVENTGGHMQYLDPLSKEEHELMARIRNCIVSLSQHTVSIYDTTIVLALEASNTYQVKEILNPEVSKEIANFVCLKILEHE